MIVRLTVEPPARQELGDPGLHALRLGRLARYQRTQAHRAVEVVVLTAGALRLGEPAPARAGRIVVVDHVDAAGRRAAWRDREVLRELRRRHGDQTAVLVDRGVAIAAQSVAHVEPAVVVGVFGGRSVRRDEVAEGVADVGVGIPAVGVHAVERFLRLSLERIGVEQPFVAQRGATVGGEADPIAERDVEARRALRRADRDCRR